MLAKFTRAPYSKLTDFYTFLGRILHVSAPIHWPE